MLMTILERNPDGVKMAYTPDTIWRNRDHFLKGRDAARDFLSKKWEREQGYRLRKELFAFSDNKVRTLSCFTSLPAILTYTELIRLTIETLDCCAVLV